MSLLNIYAGSVARKRIQEEGFHAGLFGGFLGASGGPKWFVLAGLDKVIFPEFLDANKTPIDIMGSSAGAFRAACLAQDKPAEAINRLATNYASTVYSAKPDAKEITLKGYDLLHAMLGETGICEALHSNKKNVHFFVQHCHGLVGSEKKLPQILGLSVAAAKNMMNRKFIASHFSRAVFSARPKKDLFIDPYDFPTDYYALDKENYVLSLMASGSIPIVLEGIKDIPNAKPGIYRDGGIIDYHFDLAFKQSELVLYPHFYATPTPGWFDKNVPGRQCHQSSYENVVMLVPSQEFIAKLPYSKIPDRKDFQEMEAQQRIKYWLETIKQSDRLADAFLHYLQSDDIMAKIKPIDLHRKSRM
ncbi:patatin-like phospholipase family protein [Brumicola pallidula]|uniref:PNPLA domain-containing protein n=1 Tax=Brumicola pallidula DSM 14239 = ACAM 615 TaxID=1121922 RepID=K6ZGJ1_9ALTE|nr:patatin-like phospholipase family protein [Glaciecola pallidula]GAC29467.1 hypothetical protein GPAL_2612 [Glaciecola pallidula DSM 14239 = ACAM 615]